MQPKKSGKEEKNLYTIRLNIGWVFNYQKEIEKKIKAMRLMYCFFYYICFLKLTKLIKK
jgi:hypothetical protein